MTAHQPLTEFYGGSKRSGTGRLGGVVSMFKKKSYRTLKRFIAYKYEVVEAYRTVAQNALGTFVGNAGG